MVPSHELRTVEERPDLLDDIFGLDALWEPFLLQDVCSRIIDTDLNLAPWVYAVIEHGDDGTTRTVGRVAMVPLRWESDEQRFGPRGWDGAIVDYVLGAQQGLEPNAVCLLEITLLEEVRLAGLGRWVLRAVKEALRDRGIGTVAAPVRPLDRANHLDVPMDEYVKRTNDQGQPADGWVRFHLNEGGRYVGVAPMSMTVVGTFDEWLAWTGVDLAAVEGDRATVPGALAHLMVDHAERLATYVEPNVWFDHTLIEPS